MHTDAAGGLVVDLRVPGGPVRLHVWPALEADANRPVLVAFHGWTDSGEVFGPLAHALGRRWTVVAPDAPGHGGTPWRGGDRFAVDDQVRCAAAVADALPEVAGRRAPVVVLGHSMGGVPATGLGAARPEGVRHVVLEDPVGATRHRVGRLGPLRDVEGLQQLDDAAREQVARERHPSWPEDEFGPWARSKAQVDLAALRVPGDWGDPLATRLAAVSSPVTVVRGLPERGGIVPAPAADRVAAACRGGCEVVTLDAGHNVRREARAAFVAALTAVLS